MNATLTKIDQLKQEQGIDVSSEHVLGITEPPGYQCSNIDEVINRVKGAVKDCDYTRDYIKDEELSDAEYHADAVYQELYDLDYAIEEIRTEIENVRAWGQGWKDLAKRLINETDVRIEDFI